MINFIPTDKDWDSDAALKVRESGLASFPVPPVDPNSREQLPAGGGQFPVPPHLGFSSLIGAAYRAHYHTIDEALRHSQSNADAMLREIVISKPLEDRFRLASQVSWLVEPEDETDNFQVRQAIKNTLAISKTPKFQNFLENLHWAKWYGKQGAELDYKWDKYQPDLMKCVAWTPIQGDSLVPRWANSDWGRLVNAQFDGDKEGWSKGLVHWYTPEEMESVVIHSYRAVQPDYYDGLSSGALRGRGLRHAAYWAWYCRSNLVALLLDYSERLSQGIWKGYFDSSNPTARQDLEQAVAAYRDKSMLSLPRNRDGSVPNDLVIMEVGSASPAIMRESIEYYDRLLHSYLSGTPTMSGSVGGDEIALQKGSISSTTKADAICLAEDLTSNWLPTLYRYNSPNCPPGLFVHDVESANADKLLNYAVTMRDLGWSVDLQHLAKVCGLPPGTLDKTISTKIQPLNPVATESPPQQVPIAAGPTDPSAQPDATTHPSEKA